MTAIAPMFGLDPVSLDRQARTNALRLCALADARKWRDRYFKMCKAGDDDWYKAGRVWVDWDGHPDVTGELYAPEELAAIARENWREAMVWIGKHNYV